jgi:hypothetical protein
VSDLLQGFMCVCTQVSGSVVSNWHLCEFCGRVYCDIWYIFLIPQFLRHQMMDKVQKHNSFNTSTPSSESYRNYSSQSFCGMFCGTFSFSHICAFSFAIAFRPALGPIRPSIKWVPGIIPRGKVTGARSWSLISIYCGTVSPLLYTSSWCST